jgi:hypothetical protein
MAALAETVMGVDESRSGHRVGVPGYLAKIARYPLWAISVRALVGAAILPLPVFLYAGTRYHYVVRASGEASFDQDALLAGVTLAFVGSLVGLVIGTFWGVLVVRYARHHASSHEAVGARSNVRRTDERGDSFGGDDERHRRLEPAGGGAERDRERLDGMPARSRA